MSHQLPAPATCAQGFLIVLSIYSLLNRPDIELPSSGAAGHAHLSRGLVVAPRNAVAWLSGLLRVLGGGGVYYQRGAQQRGQGVRPC